MSKITILQAFVRFILFLRQKPELLRKRFIENLAFFATLNLLIKPIYVFGIDRVVQNTVGTAVYGTYFPLFNLVLIFQIFLDLGIENFTRKEIGQNPERTSQLLSKFLVIKIALITIFVILFSAIGYFLPHDIKEWRLLVLLIINQSLASLILYFRANMGGLHLFKAESLTSVLDRLVMILICGTLLILPLTKDRFKIEWFVMAQTVAYLITLSFSLFLVLRNAKNVKLRLNLKTYVPILIQLKPYALLVLLMAFYYRVDSIFLRYMLPDGREQAGIYAHGFRILDFMSNYALIFSFILLPTFAQLIKKKQNISPLLRLSVISLIIPATALLIGISFYRVDVFQLLYPQSSILSANTFLILTISFIGICFSYTFGALLTANGNLKELNKMAIIAVIISSLLNILLIPKLEVLGAAIANASSQLFTIAYHILVASKKFELKTDKSLIARSFVFIASAVIGGYLISKTNVSWWIGIILITSMSLIISAILQLLKVSYAIEFVKNFLQKKDLSTSPEDL